jgi:hypothetical protein
LMCLNYSTGCYWVHLLKASLKGLSPSKLFLPLSFILPRKERGTQGVRS